MGIVNYGVSQKKLRRSEDWQSLVDAFRNGEIEFGFRLDQIQMLFSSFGIKLKI